MSKPQVLKYSIGVDIAKDTFAANFSTYDTEQNTVVKSSGSFKNNKSGFEKMQIWMTKHRKDLSLPISITMEATGVYYESCALFFYNEQIKVSVVLANTAKKFLQSLNVQTKNDPIDARGLAQMGAERNLNAWRPVSPNVHNLRTMTRHHEDLNKQLTRIHNQLHALQHSGYSAGSVEDSLKLLKALIIKQLGGTRKDIELLMNEDPELKRLCTLFTSIKGVGVLTAAVVIAETNGFLGFENVRQLISYAGLDVIENKSGKSVGRARISKKGNSHLRRIAHLASLSFLRFKVAPFYDFWSRIYDRTKIKMKASVAMQRKLLSVLFALAKKNELFNAEFQPTLVKKDVESPQITLREGGAEGFLSATSSAGLFCGDCKLDIKNVALTMSELL